MNDDVSNKPHRYYVTYSHADAGRLIIGSIEITQDEPIKGPGDVECLQSFINTTLHKRHNKRFDVKILAWSRFE